MSSLQRTIDSLKKLISFPSVSSTSNREISDWLSEQLEASGFDVEQTSYRDEKGVEKVNVVGCRNPASGQAATNSGFAYFAHSDVVPAVGWTGPGGDPFEAVLTEDRIFGRGSCDMKGSLAAMLAAAQEFTASQQTSRLWIVCTADEEIGFAGVKHLTRESQFYREMAQAQPVTVIGEPTRLGVVHAHKGIIGIRITSVGRAAHSSTTDGINANHRMVPMLQALLEISEETERDRRYKDDRFDPPILSWNFGVSDQCTAINITPERSVAWVSFRPMPEIDGSDLIQRVESKAKELGLTCEQFEGGSSLWMDPEAPCIRDFCQLVGGQPMTVCYGTDGGELTELENRVVFGPGDIAQAHTTNEWIELNQLDKGTDLLAKAARRWCTGSQQS